MALLSRGIDVGFVLEQKKHRLVFSESNSGGIDRCYNFQMTHETHSKLAALCACSHESGAALRVLSVHIGLVIDKQANGRMKAVPLSHLAAIMSAVAPTIPFVLDA